MRLGNVVTCVRLGRGVDLVEGSRTTALLLLMVKPLKYLVKVLA